MGGAAADILLHHYFVESYNNESLIAVDNEYDPIRISALRQSEDQLRAILDHAPAEVYLKDKEGRYVRINYKFERLFGVRDADVRGKLPHDIHYKDLADKTRAHDLAVLTTGRTIIREEQVELEDSQDNPHVLLTIKFPIHTPEGEIDGLGAIVADITDRVRAEQSVRVSEQRFRDFAEVAADGFWETDAQLRLLYASERYKELMGASLIDLFSDSTAPVQASLKAQQNFHDIEVKLNDPKGNPCYIRASGKPLFKQGCFVGYRGVVRDVTELHQVHEALVYQASHDALTGLYNRAEFERRLALSLEGKRCQDYPYALCYLDLDQFKRVNDSVGHAAGDDLLQQIASLFRRRIREDDFIARIGGDEFCVLLKNCSSEQALHVANKLVAAVRDFRFVWQHRSFTLGVSIGLVPIAAANQAAPTELLAQADMACYAAKDAGRNRVHLHRAEDVRIARQRGDALRATALGEALEHNHLRLYCQPIRALVETDAKPQFELLLRLQDDQSVSLPGSFLPAAERFGMMPAIDRWVIRQTLRSYHRICGSDYSGTISINLSGNSINDDTLLDFITTELQRNTIPPGRICFEITETAAVANFAQAQRFIDQLADKGCLFALDDFGSGFASFSYLMHLPVQFVKIDGGFVRNLHNKASRIIVSSMNELCHQLSIRTIAEFAETTEIVEDLRKLGVDYVQGYAIGKPAPWTAETMRKVF